MMTEKEIIQQRLSVQQLLSPKFEKAEDVVRWFGAVQAQDYLGSLWAVGQRTKAANEAAIEKAISDRKIVRTWPMRGTLHFTVPENVRWMLKLLTPRIVKRAASVYRQAELDKKIFMKSAKVVEKALQGKEPVTRDELYVVLEQSKIKTSNTRGLHISGYLAMQGLICGGPRKGKQPTFTLLEEWVPMTKQPDPEEAMANLAMIYFRSHGPATLEDFSWWSGLSKSEAHASLSMVKDQLVQETFKDQQFWRSLFTAVSKTKVPSTYLLPAYDEYSVAYKDRCTILDPAHAAKAGNGIFAPCVVINGKIAGTWKRSFEKNKVSVTVNPLRPFNRSESSAVKTVTRQYSKFVGVPVK
jgi:hypothetical protein